MSALALPRTVIWERRDAGDAMGESAKDLRKICCQKAIEA
jgi:hypothetical protein